MKPALASVSFVFAMFLASSLFAGRAEYLELANRGWNYQLRSTMVGRDMSIPVRINGQSLAGSSICVVGQEPHGETLDVLNAFRELVHDVFGKRLTMRYAGPTSDTCGSGRTVVLRLYSGFPPNEALSQDLERLNNVYDLGLPHGRFYSAASPAFGQTFFGRRGQGTHIMVQQAATATTDPIESLYYRSILIEELFQVFTFGMDVLQFKRDGIFLSKLQEYPYQAPHLSWNSPAFQRSMLAANPTGLCDFDLFMLHAIARANVERTNSDAFMVYLGANYDTLADMARATMKTDRYQLILNPTCQPYND